MSSAASIRIMIAEDMPLLRGGLVALLSHEADFEVIAEAERGDQVVPVAVARLPDVALIDSELPGTDGYTAAYQLYERLPSCRTLIMASSPRAGDLRRVVAARAYGLVLHAAPPKHMANAIRQVAKGQRVVDPDLAFAALDAPDAPLTPRELEVLRMAAQGAPPNDIAEDLCLTVGTVRNHLTRIINKTGARNRIDAVRIADQEGWI
jgi:two-component system response regulator DesR